MPAHLVGVGVPDDPLLPCGGMGHAALHAAIRSYVGRGALTPPQAFALPVSFRGVEDAAPYGTHYSPIKTRSHPHGMD